MNRSQDLVQAQVVLHGQDELRDQVTRVLTDDGGAQDAIGAWCGEHFDEAAIGSVSNGPIEFVDVIARDFVVGTVLARFGFVQADVRDFGIGKRAPGNDAVVDGEPLESSE